jgi:hypothetical protein
MCCGSSTPVKGKDMDALTDNELPKVEIQAVAQR